jgi:hypothetical protein
MEEVPPFSALDGEFLLDPRQQEIGRNWPPEEFPADGL